MTRGRNSTSVEGAKGQVKFFKASQGYGFIQVFEPEKVNDDVFFHISDYKADSVHKDWWMEFDIERTNKGQKAINLRRVSQPPEHELTGSTFNY